MNTKYYNYYDDLDFTEKDFIDYDHLNDRGAEKLLKKIAIDYKNIPNR